MIFQPTYKQFGEKAILIEWQSKISEEILQDILRFKQTVLSVKKVEDIIVGYNSLTLKFSKNILNFSSEVEQLQGLHKNPIEKSIIENFIWEIPVCYDVEFGIDLQELSEAKKIAAQQIIELHTQPLYTIHFIGFLPGFLYLGGLNEQLHTPRKSNPRLRVEAGSVAIGGSQTGVYPHQSAGGWNIIGQTPVNFFDVDKTIPCFAKSGDKIKFVSISKKEFEELKSSDYQPKKEVFNA